VLVVPSKPTSNLAISRPPGPSPNVNTVGIQSHGIEARGVVGANGASDHEHLDRLSVSNSKPRVGGNCSRAKVQGVAIALRDPVGVYSN